MQEAARQTVLVALGGGLIDWVRGVDAVDIDTSPIIRVEAEAFTMARCAVRKSRPSTTSGWMSAMRTEWQMVGT